MGKTGQTGADVLFEEELVAAKGCTIATAVAGDGMASAVVSLGDFDRSNVVNEPRDLRVDYRKGELEESSVLSDPIAQFTRWFDEAMAAKEAEPNAMVLATSDADGKPSARVVLLKGLDARGFVFYTNYQSRKGRELERNPRAAAVFFWEPLERQVRIEGTIERVSRAESEAYFQSRPRGSQIGAWASHQSQVVNSREVLEEREKEISQRFADQPIPLPPEWGGYRLKPQMIEFWQGRPSRLHDRLMFQLDANGKWLLNRLEP